ncbi:hypothetical protein LTR17_001132 [Elasticomyces elasticus]|nr:hypothetical protein LTR17_001132 [Elasticomyces elasticus]
MAIKRHSPTMWCILLYLLALFITGTQSREVGDVELRANDKDLGPPFTAVKAVNWQFRTGTTYGTTEAEYANIFNPQAGMMICYNNWSPSYRVSKNPLLRPEDIPPLNRLSDVLWFQWKDAVATTHNPNLVSNIKWVMRHHVADETSVKIIDTITKGFRQQSLQGWPGRTYDMSAATGSDKGAQERQIARALLGSPNGVGVAHFLSQHRADLGFKSVSKVQLWGDETGRYLLFHIIDIKEYDIL